MPYINVGKESGKKFELYYKEWGQGRPVVFSHGWPLSADAWEDQMIFLAEKGFRCIAHDRRGFGRSGQPSEGNDMDTFADDLSTLIESLDLRDVVLVGHSMGGGEVARYIGRHGSSRLSKVVLIGAVTPFLLKTNKNPNGLPMPIWDDFRAKLLADRAQYFKDFTIPFYGANRRTSHVSEGLRDSFWRQGMMASLKSVVECVKAFSETNFYDDLAKFDKPTLILHGDDDQVVPLNLSATPTSKLVKNATLKVYPGLPHGLCQTHKEKINEDLLAFIQAEAAVGAR